MTQKEEIPRERYGRCMDVPAVKAEGERWMEPIKTTEQKMWASANVFFLRSVCTFEKIYK